MHVKWVRALQVQEKMHVTPRANTCTCTCACEIHVNTVTRKAHMKDTTCNSFMAGLQEQSRNPAIKELHVCLVLYAKIPFHLLEFVAV